MHHGGVRKHRYIYATKAICEMEKITCKDVWIWVVEAEKVGASSWRVIIVLCGSRREAMVGVGVGMEDFQVSVPK